MAYLKAQLDHKNDHIGMFMPLVTDVLAHIQDDGLTSARVKEELFSEHGIAMPEHVVSTLLKRAVGARTLRREAGRYFKIAGVIPPSEVRAAKKELELAQDRLAKALQAHAAKRGLTVPSEDDSMDMLMRFLEAEKVGMLLRSWFPTIEEADPSQKEASIVAEFI